MYYDNFISKPALFKKLETNLMDTCGTERTSRKGLPTGMKLQNLK
jgi:hypothetical protein